MANNDIAIQQYCLRWNNHRSNLLNVLDELLQNEAFTDVTLAVDGGFIKCHKMVLIACSSYFQSLFLNLPCKHPIVVLKDVKYLEMKAILEYMYRGEVNVAQEQLSKLLKIAEVLKVKGLVEENGGNGSHVAGQREEAETSMSPPPAISTSTGGTTHSSDHASPPHSTGGTYNLYGGSSGRSASVDRNSQTHLVSSPIWPLPGLPLHHGSSHQRSSYSQHSSAIFGGTSYDNGFETSPLKRKKMQQSNQLINRDTPILRTVLGQGHADSSQTGVPLLQSDSHEGHFRSSSNGPANDDRRGNTDLTHGETAHSPYTDAMDEEQPSPQSYPGDSKSGILGLVPTQKPEWKRYKQYTRDDITSAIEAVKAGMSAVQAARRHGVPSRTLYDKVKKLGITTSRPFKRASNGGSSACFPYGIGSNVNGSIYSTALPESENDNSNVIEGAANTSLETVYAKAEDKSQDRGDTTALLDVAQCNPSPVICCIKQQQQEQEQNLNDEVEDLSVSRKSNVTPTSDMIKEEAQDVKPDDSCEYN